MSIFAEGVRLTRGTPYTPSLRFLDDPYTGLFLSSDKELGFAVKGSTVLSCSVAGVNIKKGLKYSKGAVSNAYLRGDSNGNAYWQESSMQSGAVNWNSIYSTIDTKSDNNSLLVEYSMPSVPNVTFSMETPFPIADNSLYIRNKSAQSCEIYSSLPVLTKIVEADVSEVITVRLSNNCLGICYYDIDQDRVFYIYSKDHLGQSWSDPIIVDDVSSIGQVSMTIVDGHPAICHIYNDGTNDEWRYTRANDMIGSSWDEPNVLYTSTSAVGFLPVTVQLLVVNGRPACFYNDENGRAKLIRALDSTGSAWGSSINISNLTNHQILQVKIVNNRPALVARSNAFYNVYYVRSSDDNGNTWPIGATQLYKTSGNTQILANSGRSACDMGYIEGSLCIAISELSTNDLYLSAAIDNIGNIWGGFNLIMDAQTTALYPKFFINNQNTYLLLNKSIGSPSTKSLIKFSSITSYTITQAFLTTFETYGGHYTINNINDGNSCIIFASENNVFFLRFYDDEFKINWIAHTL